MKVSIVTICYNSAKTIEQTIQSVLNQTYSNIEYIIIDGGSTDGTINIIKKYEKQIAYWVSEPDKGISDAFNKGVRNASGDVIGIINSDDFYKKDTIMLVVESFNNDDQVGFVFGDMIFLDDKGKEIFEQKGTEDYLKSIHYTMPSIAHPTVFVKRIVYEKFGHFVMHLRTAMDYEFLLRITKNGVNGKYIPNVMAYMRLEGESDINYINGYKEVYVISVFYGYSIFLGLVRFLLKSIKTFIRKQLQFFQLSIIVKYFRKLFSKRYVYK